MNSLIGGRTGRLSAGAANGAGNRKLIIGSRWFRAQGFGINTKNLRPASSMVITRTTPMFFVLDIRLAEQKRLTKNMHSLMSFSRYLLVAGLCSD